MQEKLEIFSTQNSEGCSYSRPYSRVQFSQSSSWHQRSCKCFMLQLVHTFSIWRQDLDYPDTEENSKHHTWPV